MDQRGHLSRNGDRYEFHFEEIGLTVRGTHPEWVLEAAAEVISDTERARAEGRIEELETLSSLGEADELDLDDARYEATERFEQLPQCTVSLGSMDYRWHACVDGPSGRRRRSVQRVHQVSLMRGEAARAAAEGGVQAE